MNLSHLKDIFDVLIEKFNPLWKLTETEQSDINLKHAQANSIYIESAVLSPNEIRKKGFQDLKDFDNLESESLNFSTTPHL